MTYILDKNENDELVVLSDGQEVSPKDVLTIYPEKRVYALRGQMGAIREAVEDQLGLHIPIAGLVKDDKHRTHTLLYGFPPKEIGMKPTDEVFRFLTQIQDEVHRFAISFHKQRRSKSQTDSELDQIPGIGEKTKTELLKAFKSLKRLREAKLEDIQKICGTNRGSIVYEHFHGKISL